ncbi:extracellular solute-binding protein [Clostridium sp. AL.422]|uniref:extracellular solute-binding protein n=1 Tax=Clostridium TaxID=1485 RepID=UPI00293DFF68|nr:MULTISPECIES: extracellular solute-binding protein [unclassified Clostridium]MDV4151386.1 extracellular solute-binding protein [Clostridium sp. AL.422]
MKKRRLISIIAIAMITISVFAGCGKSEDTNGKVDKEVRILTAVTGGKDEAEMKLFEEALEKGTGLQITMEKPASDYDNVLMQKLQSGEKYDLIYIGQSQLANLVEQEALTDITKYVEESEILGNESIIPKSEWDLIRMDGKIYSGFNKKEVHRNVNINEVMAEKAGIKVNEIKPTLEGYYEVFKKMKENNTDPSFYPINASFVKMYDLQPWFASLGLKGGIVKDGENNTVPWASDEAIPVWEWFNKLYSEGLLDPDSVTDTTKELRNKFQTGKTGVIVDWAAWTGLYNVNAAESYPNDFKATPLAGTKKSDGEFMLTRGEASLWGVPSNSENVEGAIKVLEYFASEEGSILLSVGIEGNDYTVEGDKYVLTADGEKHGKDHGAPVPINNEFVHPIGWNPGFEDAMNYLKYATSEMSSPLKAKYEEIVSKHGVQIIKGSVDAETGLKAMREELKTAGVISN